MLLEFATWRVAKDHLELDVGGVGLETRSINRKAVREEFLSIAKKSIPYHMGEAYMEVVVACLDDTHQSHTSGTDFVEMFRSQIIEKLSAKQLLQS